MPLPAPLSFIAAPMASLWIWSGAAPAPCGRGGRSPRNIQLRAHTNVTGKPSLRPHGAEAAPLHIQKASPFIAACLLAFTAVAPASELVTKEAVTASLAEHRADWEARIKAGRPRLLVNGKDWPQAAKEMEALAGPRAQVRERIYQDLDKLLAKPLPTYDTPENLVGKPGFSKTLYAAQEELWQRDVGNEIFALAIVARLKPGEARYRERLHDLVLRTLTFETWGRAYPKMGNNADLAAGHVGRGIALAYDWHPDVFTDAERAEIRRVIAERLPCLLKALYGDAFWAKGYGENHNHVSVSALAYCGIAFYDDIPGAPEWLAAARLNFQKVGEEMPADGSSPEGVSYWTYGMSFILQYIEGARLVTDSADLYKLPFLRGAPSYRLMASASGLTGNLPWGDAMPKDVWGGPHHILYRLAAEYRDADAAWLADNLPFPNNSGIDERLLHLLWSRNAPASGQAPTELDTHLAASDLVSSRTGWAASDYLLAIKSGYTNRNHSHLDAGALALALGDEWILIASGYGKGSGDKDFWQSGGPRWEYFSNATQSHATLIVNGKNQRFDKNARGTVTQFFSAPEYNWTAIDLGKAYGDVKSIRRHVLHRRGEYILVFDAVTADQPVSVEWLAQFRTDPATEADGGILTTGKNGKLRVRVIEPALPLAKRAPTSPKVDVDSKKHFTYAAKQEGAAVQFTTLLQPLLKGKDESSLAAATVNSVITVKGPSWTDHLAKDRLEAAGAKVQGQLAVVRETGGSPGSLLALGATSVDFPAFRFTSAKACDLAARKLGDGSWQVTASREIAAEVTPAPGVRITYHLP
jgi:hypothetical protein